VPAKSIQTPQELLVLHTIVRSGADGSKSLLGYANNEYLGPYSATARGNWALQRLHLQMLVDTQAWEQLLGACETLLTNAQPERKDEEGYDPRGSDWLVWECFVRAVMEMGTTRHVDCIDGIFILIVNLARRTVLLLREKLICLGKLVEVLTKGMFTSELWNMTLITLGTLMRFMPMA
jgi:hypothetical protein